MCVTKIFSAKGSTMITGCPGCKSFYILHNNLVLSFTKESFVTFRKELDSISFEQDHLVFPGGLERIILRTPNRDISFSFAAQEFELFKLAVEEAIYMKEVYKLIRQ